MKKITILTLFLLISGLLATAQQRECGMEEYMAQMMQDPEFARQWEINQTKFREAVQQSLSLEYRQNVMDPIVIPVAVHFPSGLESDRACLEALAQNQIDILNGDYTATNPDANLWTAASGFYPGVVHGAANIQFCIATSNHPEDTDPEIIEGGPAVTIGYDFGGGNDSDPAWSGYMNFLVKDIGGGLLGYSPLGGNINAGQSVVMNLGAFGSGSGCPDSGIVPGAPYDLGRTVTHELGHFFNLEHPFSGSCATDDGIADTPNISDPNYGCPDPGTVPACDPTEFALTMSYMDYGNDACLYMFSEGQTDVVDNYVSAVLQAQFKPNTVPVCVETPEYVMTDDTINTCSGIFYDSGGPVDGASPGNYANNENFTFTICPNNTGQVIQLDFTEFSTQNNADIMSIYNASDASDPATLIGEFSGTNSPGTIAATTTNTSGCLTIVFTSSASISDSGWQANISCQTPPSECQTISAVLDSAFPEPNAEGYILVCPGEEITLSGSGQFSEPGGGFGAAYQWETGDGTTISGQTATFSFDEPGVYVANLNVWDTNTSVYPEGCQNTNLINQIIQVSTTPDFTGTEAENDRLCYGDTTTLTPVVTPTSYLNECTPPESELTFLPDGSGVSYETSIIVDCFESDQTLDDINQLVEICLELEHSYLGDLDIEIISPSGQVVFLQNQGGGSANLGVPWATSTVDGESTNTTPGEGYNYCFVPDDSYPTLVEGIQSGGTFPVGDGPGTYTDSFVPAGVYSSDDSLDGLLGSSLNGSWTIRITDNIGADNGYIFSWTLNFDPAIQPPDLSFTPEIVSGSWLDDSTITETNGDTITIAPPNEGQYCYTYVVEDNFGCEYTHEVCVDVLPELIHDLPNDLFICDPGAAPYVFDLSVNEATVLAPNPNPADFVVTFHNTQEDAEIDANPITNLSNYEGSDGELIYIRFEYQESRCFEIETFQLNLLAAPEIFPASDLVLCDDESNDGSEPFNLDAQTLDILGPQSSTGFTVTYYEDLANAEAGTNNLSSPYTNISNIQPIYVRVQITSGTGCYIVSPDPVFNLVVTNKALATTPSDLALCDSSGTGSLEATFDLDQQTATI
ncbi:MAG: proprotein convertase P-domain-containing protein, partial [Flavobacteriaceae bacterium]